MNTDIQKTDTVLQRKLFGFFVPTPKNILYASLISFIIAMVAVTACLAGLILSKDGIYKGVYINNMYVGTLSSKDATKLLQKKFTTGLDKKVISLSLKSASEMFSLSDIKAEYAVSDAVDKAYSIGRTGNIFTRLYDVFDSNFNGRKIDIQVKYDKQKVDGIINSLYDKTLVKVKDPDLLFKENMIVIYSGRNGINMDKAAAAGGILKLVKAGTGGTIDVPVVRTPPSRIDVENLYKTISRDVKDAAVTIVNNKCTITPEVTGRSIDKAELAEIASELENTEDKEVVLPVKFITPKVTQESLNKSLFKDDLNTFSSKYNTNTQNNRNRAINIKLAVAKINNTMLAPGQVFSVNEVVGSRTAEAGYKDAYTFENGRMVKGIGGGLCQVVSTLYNAVLRSDLEVVNRRNHSFAVTYVPLGMDATVAGTVVDFKFKNSTKWPIKILCWTTSDNRVYFSIKGTNENPGKTVEMSSKVISSTPYKTVFIDDPSLPEGKINPVPRQEGHTGYVVETYKTIKQNGKVVSTQRIHTSRYKVMNEEILRGPVKALLPPPGKNPNSNPNPNPAVKDPPAANTVNPVDDADNPPAIAE